MTSQVTASISRVSRRAITRARPPLGVELTSWLLHSSLCWPGVRVAGSRRRITVGNNEAEEYDQCEISAGYDTQVHKIEFSGRAPERIPVADYTSNEGRNVSMPRRSIRTLLVHGMHSHRASGAMRRRPNNAYIGSWRRRPVRGAASATRPAVDRVHSAPAGTSCGCHLVSGEVQLVARGVDLALDITAKHFDMTGYPRREHACGTLTRVETQRLIAALVAFLASTPGTSEAA